MGENTKIQWCDHTFNGWRGCTKVSAGCQHCYAEAQAGRNPGVLGVWGPKGKRVVAAESSWRQPIRWNAKAARDGVRRRVFCGSMCDVFEDYWEDMTDSQERILLANQWWPECGVGAGDRLLLCHVRERLGRLIQDTPSLDWLLLTKRPENVVRMADDHMFGVHDDGRTGIPPNVWVGASVEDQAAADTRIPHLLQVPARVRFLSCEPLLGPVELTAIGHGDQRGLNCLAGEFCYYRESDGEPVSDWGECVNWVIIGGESGLDARSCNVEWVRSMVRQCRSADVACFVKQLGSRPTTRLGCDVWPGGDGRPETGPIRFHGDGFGNYLVRGLRDPKAGDPSEWPEDLRVRQFPTVES